jgi:hypothetical protein
VATVEEVIFLEWLVETGEDEVLVIVAEVLGNLGPDFLQPCNLVGDGGFAHSLVAGCRLAETADLDPSSVPMVVDDDIQPIGYAVVHHLLHTAHPRCVDGAVVGIGDMAHHP